VNQPLRPDLEDTNKRLRSALIAFFTRRLGNGAEAEDMTQEVFIRLARSNRSPIESHDSYVFAIAANLLRDKARREKVRADYREERRLADYVGVDTLDPFRVAAGRQHLAEIARIIADLPEKTQRIFTLYRIENIDKQSIAESFGLSVRMVEVHIRRAMVALYEQMDLDA
jgi:RNA polymerase sigma-70 factor (ECF subfamily)